MKPVIEVDSLRKTYRTGFRMTRVEALKGIGFRVEPGEIFGFVGPNGAGKTTTIRTLMGLIRPSSGSARIFGEPVSRRTARLRVGFLPESPYFYDYLTAPELLDLVGRLSGLPARTRQHRSRELLELVGLAGAGKKVMKKFSKGMLQRAGIAQALMSDPDLVVFDEPMSGLDPVGRKEVRDIIISLRDRGKTVFFSSHILADVEMICDRIAIIVGGTLHHVGPLSHLLNKNLLATEVALALPEGFDEERGRGLWASCTLLGRVERQLWLSAAPGVDVDALLAQARELGVRVVSVTPHRETLEDVFVRMARQSGAPAAAPPPPRPEGSAGGPPAPEAQQ
jgi:ABC-2 type transport system ATP-binding protein